MTNIIRYYNCKLYNCYILLQIVGWGTTEQGIDSSILLEASLPYFNNSFCRNMFTNGFESFVTVDKFCAGSASGINIFKHYNTKSLNFLTNLS